MLKNMLTSAQSSFLASAFQAAQQAGHVFPEMAACEAALESKWGASELAQFNNLFGQKQQKHPIYSSISIPTREFINDRWIVENAEWVSFPTVADCFSSRMDTLRRLAPEYPHYAASLAATTPEEYVMQVSKSWSTDPNRASNCIAIFDSHRNLLK